MMTRDEALTLLDKALAAATAAGCEAADAVLYSAVDALTRFANNTIHQNVASERDSLTLRAVLGQRTGVVHTGILTAHGIKAAAKKAVEIAASTAGDPEFPGIVASPPAPQVGIFDDETAAAAPAARADAVVRIIRCIESANAVASGSLSTGAYTLAAANTAGTRQYDRTTNVELNVVAMAGNAGGTATASAARLGEVNPLDRAQFALQKCLDSRDPADLEPGDYTVILEPIAVADLVMYLTWLGFGALEMQEGHSCLQGKLGLKVFDDRITIIDDAADPAGAPFGFDGEGVPKQRVELVRNGVFKNVVYNLRTARKDGVQSTGHGHVPPSTHGPYAGNLIMSPGHATLDEMIESTDRGLLVSYLHYTNVAEPSDCTITGMTRYGLFAVIGGEITRPVKNLRLTQSVLAALNDVAAVGKRRERFGSFVVPALKINRFRFTGKSDH